MDRRGFAGRLLVALGAVAAASTSALRSGLAAMVPGKGIDLKEFESKVMYRAKYRVDGATGALVALNDGARAALARFGPDHMAPVIAKKTAKDGEDLVLCGVYYPCNCGGEVGCNCVPRYGIPCSTNQSGSCSCCTSGACCGCTWIGSTSCWLDCEIGTGCC